MLAVAPTADRSDAKLGEHAIYPLLSLYPWEEFGVYSKRIDYKRASNKRGPNGNRWLYPDVVGMKDLGAERHQEVRDCVNQHSDKRTKLWSFEALLPGGFQLVVGKFWLFGRSGDREAGHAQRTADAIRGARHRLDQIGFRQPGRESGLDSGS